MHTRMLYLSEYHLHDTLVEYQLHDSYNTDSCSILVTDRYI